MTAINRYRSARSKTLCVWPA